MSHKPFDLEDRLIAFASLLLVFLDSLSKKDVGVHFRGQMIRSGTSSAFNYGEAQAAESRRDFAHKMQIVLKEVRETQIALKILQIQNLGDSSMRAALIDEVSQLVAIFTTSVKKVRG